MVALLALLTVHFGTTFSALKWWPDAFAVATNLLAGGIVSFLFYYLVIYYPERRKKAILKKTLAAMYKNIKHDILFQVVFASIKGGRNDLTTYFDEIEKLMQPAAFKAAFGDGREATEGFYAFANQMHEETPEFRNIVLSWRMLSKQIEFVLHNYSIDDQQLFDTFKGLELTLMRLQTIEPGYNEAKTLCWFIWENFAGWSFIDGYIGYDRIERAIESI